ncbi:DUF3618 domain-containing protein [Rhodococcus sp. B50]|uniref:DUF3618 domain-containing protein n=1 Tax=Rhodococcus sp. B50 TaxID=2682847 RepID=UPI0019D90012|nr:DUF3618 domain-containing protein [Rhodococcus sp. B50]MBS9373682.1 hypothetical protein [Rhodococcus sp. B50]
MTASDNGGRPEDVADIERQRAELAATVGELTDRLDVPTRVKQSAAERAEVVRNRPDLIAAAGGVLAAVIVLVIVRRRRRT